MEFTAHFGNSQALQETLATLTHFPNRWLYIPIDTIEVNLNTLCTPRLSNTSDMSEEEADKLEAFAQGVGLKPFLLSTDLLDITANLKQQCSAYSQTQLVAAINHYWIRDAFIKV